MDEDLAENILSQDIKVGDSNWDSRMRLIAQAQQSVWKYQGNPNAGKPIEWIQQYVDGEYRKVFKEGGFF
jgi:hypothetical protein